MLEHRSGVVKPDVASDADDPGVTAGIELHLRTDTVWQDGDRVIITTENCGIITGRDNRKTETAMDQQTTAFCCDRLFDGRLMHRAVAVLVRDGRVTGTCVDADIPDGATPVDLGAGILVPGFVDLQVNGGGGVMFNDRQDTDTLARICQAHAALGATSILPTLITESFDHVHAAIGAARQALAAGVPGFAGLHLEGPHLDPRRKGAHDPGLIRSMEARDLALLCDAAQSLPALMVTLAPESVSADQVAALVSAGVVVSLGHSGATYEQCRALVQAGARCATHLFNAMSPLTNREPGLVGAALDLGDLSCGLIADGVHVHPVAMRLALRAKQGPGQIFLVSDAMAPAGTDQRSFMLNGREIRRESGRLTLADGTLAGADLDLATALQVMVRDVGCEVETALRMATSIPAAVIGNQAVGQLRAGVLADMVHLNEDLVLQAVWQQGRQITT
jgi:N-acetylglucosamine-6-phosphate deacetylase